MPPSLTGDPTAEEDVVDVEALDREQKKKEKQKKNQAPKDDTVPVISLDAAGVVNYMGEKFFIPEALILFLQAKALNDVGLWCFAPQIKRREEAVKWVDRTRGRVTAKVMDKGIGIESQAKELWE